MQIYARQGDLVIEKLEKITGALEPAKAVTFAGDSSGHPHALNGTCSVRREGRRTFIKVAARREITHGKPDGHKTVVLKPGAYVVRPLRERGDGSDRAVED